MKNIKIETGKYLDKYSSINKDIVWNKLTSLIKEHKNKFSSINYDYDNFQIIVSFIKKDDIISEVGLPIDIEDLLLKNLNRQIRLNTTFDKSTKYLKLSDENVSNFLNHNEVIYSIDCKNIKNENALFFHESSLVNYVENDLIADLKNCNTFLTLFTCDEIEEICTLTGEKISSKITNKDFYLCVEKNTANDFIIDDEFKNLNKNINLNINEFISAYNNENLCDNEFIKISKINDDLVKIYKFKNFKMAISEFLLPNKNEIDFLNFKNFSSYYVYNTFLINLRKQLEKICGI